MITFDINGAIIKFDEKRDNYNRIRNEFKDYGSEASEKFKNYCLDNSANMRRLNEKQLEYGENLINEAIRKGVETIVNYNIITIDYNLFKEIIPLEHPRFIMQYNSKNKDLYLKKYLEALKK